MDKTAVKLTDQESYFVIAALDFYLRQNFAPDDLDELEAAMQFRRSIIDKINTAKQWSQQRDTAVRD